MLKQPLSIGIIHSIADADFSQLDTQSIVIFDLIDTLIDPADDQTLIEPLFVDVISELKGRNIKVIILSHLNIVDNKTMERCYTMLNNLSLDVSNSFENTKLSLPMFDTLLKEKPVYFKGILFTNGYPKTEVFGDFLFETKFVPSKIVFIDDHLEYVESLNRFAIKKEIPFQGYHYTGAQKIPVVLVDTKVYF